MLQIARTEALSILRLIIKPLMRFCLEHSLSIQDIESAARTELVKLTHSQMKARGEKINASRLSITTGVYRQEIDRILNEPEVVENEPPGVLARIIGRWEQDPTYCNKSGGPRALTFEGNDSEFTKLVISITTALGPAAVLFALERKNLIKRHRGTIRLLRRGNVTGDAISGYRLAAKDIQTTLSALEVNLGHTDPIGHSHIRTEYDNIYESDLPKIKQWINNQVRLFHRKARKFISKHDGDIKPRHNPELKAGAKVALTTASFSASKDDPNFIE